MLPLHSEHAAAIESMHAPFGFAGHLLAAAPLLVPPPPLLPPPLLPSRGTPESCTTVPLTQVERSSVQVFALLHLNAERVCADTAPAPPVLNEATGRSFRHAALRECGRYCRPPLCARGLPDDEAMAR